MEVYTIQNNMLHACYYTVALKYLIHALVYNMGNICITL